MSDLRESFPTLENASTGAGEAPIARTEGEAAAAQRGSIGFAFKDSSGNVVLPQLTAEGKILVDTEASNGSPVRAQGKVTPAAINTVTVIATLTLVATRFYRNIEAMASCFRDSEVEVVWNDNGTPTTLWQGLVGPGQYSLATVLRNLQIQAGATGTQQLLLRGTNLDKVSDLRGTIIAIENAS